MEPSEVAMHDQEKARLSSMAELVAHYRRELTAQGFERSEIIDLLIPVQDYLLETHGAVPEVDDE